MNALKRAGFAATISMMVTALIALVVHWASVSLLERLDWFNSWEYLTQLDPELGFTLRPNTHSQWSGVPVFIDSEGFRVASKGSVATAVEDAELVVFSSGDSNTFGIKVRHEETYSARLEVLLQARNNSSVRVINFGVPGHGSLHSRLHLEHWMRLKPDVIIFPDSFNNTVATIRIASPDNFAVEYHEARPHEIAGGILYPLIAYQRWRQPDPGALPALPLDKTFPARLPLTEYRQALEAMVKLAKHSDALLIFLTTGNEVGIERMAYSALESFRLRRWSQALSSFDGLSRLRKRWSINWRYAYLSAVQAGQSQKAEEIMRDYAAEFPTQSYTERFVRYSFEYLTVMQQVSRKHGVPMIDMRADFAQHGPAYLDVCHYGPAGHAMVARRLADLIQSQAWR